MIRRPPRSTLLPYTPLFRARSRLLASRRTSRPLWLARPPALRTNAAHIPGQIVSSSLARYLLRAHSVLPPTLPRLHEPRDRKRNRKAQEQKRAQHEVLGNAK